MIARRQLLKGSAGLAGLAAGASLLGLSDGGHSAGEDYRALVVLFLMGGNDGNNVIVPTDAMYADYQNARANLALPKASLAALPGSANPARKSARYSSTASASRAMQASQLVAVRCRCDWHSASSVLKTVASSA